MKAAVTTLKYNELIATLAHHFSAVKAADTCLANWMGSTFSHSQVVALLNEVLHNPELLNQIATCSYHRGNGFLKVVLAAQQSWKLRLHAWFPNTPCEENIHNHRWSFASTVLCGSLFSETFVDDPAGKIAGKEYLYFANTRHAASHKIDNGRFRLRSQGRQIRHTGDSYFLPASVLHRICDHPRKGLVATMVCSAPTQLSANRLLVSNDRGGINPSVVQTALQASELATLLQRFLKAYAQFAPAPWIQTA